jgi:RimJ/RimL family protein N-acetyltransferase
VDDGAVSQPPVELREEVDADLPILFAYQAEPEGNEMAAFPARDEAAFRAHKAKTHSDPGNLLRTIAVEGRVVGSISSWDAEGERDVGYWIGRDHWGNGYATAALRAFLEIETTRPLWVHIAGHNIGSQRVAERCGFVLDREVQEDVLMRIYVLPT